MFFDMNCVAFFSLLVTLCDSMPIPDESSETPVLIDTLLGLRMGSLAPLSELMKDVCFFKICTYKWDNLLNKECGCWTPDFYWRCCCTIHCASGSYGLTVGLVQFAAASSQP